MVNCTPIKTKPFRICAGDLRHRIVINTRSILPNQSNGVDFNESFTDPKVVYSMIETVDGETIFDATNVEQVVTHHFYIRFMKNLTFEGWVLYKQKYYDILGVENLNEEDRFMLIRANLRGTELKPVNFA